MRLPNGPVVVSATIAALMLYPSGATHAQLGAGVHVRIDILKKAPPGRRVENGPILLGPQPALELEWRVDNHNDGSLEMPSPAAVLRLRVVRQGREIPVRTEWATDMVLRTTDGNTPGSTTVPLGPATVPGDSGLRIRSVTTLLDKAPFAAGDYVLTLGLSDLPLISLKGVRRVRPVETGFPIALQILALDSPQRQRQFHMIEGAFYRRIDTDRALEHYAALAVMPDALWSDSLPLAYMYGDLGRHHDATIVYRRILPAIIRGLETAFGRVIREGRQLRTAAMSFAADGDTATAAYLLKLEGLTPEGQIPAEVERLRKFALTRPPH